MSQKRPWKVHYHYDGTKQFSDNESMPGAYTIDTSRSIDGTMPYSEQDTADAVARKVSRNGGSARVTLRNPATGAETEIATYMPYQAAMEDLTAAGTPD